MDYGQPVRFGVFITPDATQPDRPLALAQRADELGFDLIDDAVKAAGRDPRSIRRILNASADVPPELFVALTVDYGMDTYLIGDSGDDPDGMIRRFAKEVAPRVRESVAKARA